jgi:hypothetical protein
VIGAAPGNTEGQRLAFECPEQCARGAIVARACSPNGRVRAEGGAGGARASGGRGRKEWAVGGATDGRGWSRAAPDGWSARVGEEFGTPSGLVSV